MSIETVISHGSTYKKGSHGFIFRLSCKSSGRKWLKSSMDVEYFDKHLEADKKRTIASRRI